MYRSHVLVCGGTGCTSSGSQPIIQTLKDELKKNRLHNESKEKILAEPFVYGRYHTGFDDAADSICKMCIRDRKRIACMNCPQKMTD